jgi:uncharacterized protein (DUF736 family)
MATIGTFTKSADGSYAGSIHTLDLNVPQAVLRPTDGRGVDFRLYSGKAEIGVGWKKMSQAQQPYVTVKIDDPRLDAPIFAALLDADEGYNLVWTRTQPQMASVPQAA